MFSDPPEGVPAMNPRLFFASDYQEGAHPAILEALAAENLIPHAGYGTDPVSEEAARGTPSTVRSPQGEKRFCQDRYHWPTFGLYGS